MALSDLSIFCQVLQNQAQMTSNPEEKRQFMILSDRILEKNDFNTFDAVIEYAIQSISVTKARKERRKDQNRWRILLTRMIEDMVGKEFILGNPNNNDIEFPELNDEIDQLVSDY